MTDPLDSDKFPNRPDHPEMEERNVTAMRVIHLSEDEDRPVALVDLAYMLIDEVGVERMNELIDEAIRLNSDE